MYEVGDVVLLRAGDKIPADGVLVTGETHVDESMVTGEAMPVQKKKGSLVIGGTVNGHGRVDFRAALGRDSGDLIPDCVVPIEDCTADVEGQRRDVREIHGHASPLSRAILREVGGTGTLGPIVEV